MVDFETSEGDDFSESPRASDDESPQVDLPEHDIAVPRTTPRNEGLTRAPLALLYLNVLIIATCGLVYELLAGTLASYVLGDSVTQFSLIIGVYLSALGVGAWVSSFVKRNLARVFIEVELGVALLGGASTPLLFLSFARLTWFHPLLYGIVFGIGVLVGLELPLLMRILKNHLNFEDLVSRVLAFDYIGALVASLLFPLFLVPTLGLVRTSLVFGMLNAGVGLWGTVLLRPILSGGVGALRVRAAFVLALLAVGIIKADRLTTLAEENLFAHRIVYSKTTPYQRIVVTQNRKSFQLHLNGNLQFDSFDEYRYHEALVHPVMAAAPSRKNILILGGGDGLAVREVLRYDDVERVTLVDIDPGITSLAAEFAPLSTLNEASLADDRVRVVNHDAMIWLEQNEELFDVVVIDFPDPNSFSLGKLYTTHFYAILKQRLADDAVLGIQCTSPLLARQSYWCVIRTLEAAGFHVCPYHASVPSFGDWGFALAGTSRFVAPRNVPEPVLKKCRFLTNNVLLSLFQLPRDMTPVDVRVNRLDNQALVRYYESESEFATGP
ncbi:MAG: polyamine aminopropyltransferase [Planctomycetota bacterium]|jgi:spermidine synthase